MSLKLPQRSPTIFFEGNWTTQCFLCRSKWLEKARKGMKVKSKKHSSRCGVPNQGRAAGYQKHWRMRTAQGIKQYKSTGVDNPSCNCLGDWKMGHFPSTGRNSSITTWHEQVKSLFPPQVSSFCPNLRIWAVISTVPECLQRRIFPNVFLICAEHKFTLHQTCDIYLSLGFHKGWERKLGG